MLLLAGTPMERVSMLMLLVDTSIKITGKHYAPWVRSRQKQLEADVTRAWSSDSFLNHEIAGTNQVQIPRGPIN